MTVLAPLPVFIPFLVAALMAIGAGRIERRTAETLSIGTAVASTALSLALLFSAMGAPEVYWFSGWRPRHGIALGVSFSIDPMGAGTAAMVGLLVTSAFVFAWHYFEETVGHRFHILMLLFLGSMAGFALTGDLFNLFVWFELMSVAAYALTGYEIERPSAIQGGLNFGIINTIGSFALLLGVGLVYGRTGALNLAQIGKALSGGPVDGLVVVAFTLIVAGFLVKAAAVPFHFWLSDAYTVAPIPACVLFAGIMSELGLFGLARIYWTAFHGVLDGYEADLSHVLLGFGVLTALVGAAMSFAQQHIKRLLAFATISQIGLFLIGIALFDYVALAGSAIYVVAHALVTASLFLGTGIILHRLGSVDEEFVRGRGRELRWTAVLFAIGGLAVAELPPFGTFTGKTLIEGAASLAGYPWVPWVFGIAAALAGGAVLRAAGRVFLGWGPEELDRFASERFGEEEEESETREGRDHTPATMFVPFSLLLAGGLAIGLIPGLSSHVETASARFMDTNAYRGAVLEGSATTPPAPPPQPPSSLGIFYGMASTAAAVALAALALFRKRLPAAWRRRTTRVFQPAVFGLRNLHSGHVGDYTAWLVVGLSVLGGLFIVATR